MRSVFKGAQRLQCKSSKLDLFFSSASFSTYGPLNVETGKDFGEELEGYTVIKEGEAKILMNSSNSVFCNRAQVNNRDLSIAVLRTFISKRKEDHVAMSSKEKKLENRAPKTTPCASIVKKLSIHQHKLNKIPEESEGILNGAQCTSSWKEDIELEPPRVLEALAASGLRSIRYALEVDGIGQVVALDRDKESVEACMKNVQLNGCTACSKVEVHLADARIYMLTHPKEFEAVDLDPYGSPSMFLDSAVQSIIDGGLLMCSATDLAVLCGSNGDVCYSKYGSYPLKGKYCHEMALRILLACIESHANRYKRFIVPVLSVYMDYYIRVFVRIFTSASEMKNAPLRLSYVYQCVGCDSYHLQCLGRTAAKYKNDRIRYAPGVGPVVPKECCDCGSKFNMGGPIWSAPIHDQEWIESISENVESMKERYPAYEKVSAVLRTISEELHDVPLFVSLHNLCATLKCTCPTVTMFLSAISSAGYRLSGSHTTPLALKTDAPMTVIWDIMRCWVKNHPVKSRQSGESGMVILSKAPTLQANFSQKEISIRKNEKKRARFLPNPEKYWGPNIRAGRRITSKNDTHQFPQRVNVSDDPEGNGPSPSSVKPDTDMHVDVKEGRKSCMKHQLDQP